MIELSAFRHPREKAYFFLAAALGVCCLPLTIPLALMLAPMMWLASAFFRASLYGNAALVSERQYPEIHKMVLDGCRQLGLAESPKVFVTHGEGALNAFAVKFFKGQYVILYAGLIDLMVEKKMARELKMIIGHELGHHAAGHTNPWKALLIMPAQMMPYMGMAYSRACEFTADRLGAACAGDLMAAKRALVTMAVGSKALNTDMAAFVAQEAEVGMLGRVSELYASHPRLTRRVLELDAIAPLMPKRKTGQIAASREVPMAEATAYENVPVDR